MNRKIFISTILCLLHALFLCAGENTVFLNLAAQGFPYDYIEKIAPLKKRHPAWTFEILPVSKLQKKYSWDYVLEQETDAVPERSLISNNKKFSAYFHIEDKKNYDAACRRASKKAVAYFLDPRNFLNEKNIFQFADLGLPENVDTAAVSHALHGTFMAAHKLENGKTYAEYFCELGRIFSINPIFLAVRARQEQGIDGTPLVSGKCGSLLLKFYSEKPETLNGLQILVPDKKFEEKELQSYDNLYNFFNINAFADGCFMIYLNGMIEAETGSPHMAEIWGSPAWNTKWKSLYGGAYKISGKYIGNYQNTIYLQKWNVDPRCRTEKGGSKNFWGQYMQNIGAAFSESVNIFNSLKKQNLLELPFRFVIPVYDNMPESPSPDPAGGKCIYQAVL